MNIEQEILLKAQDTIKKADQYKAEGKSIPPHIAVALPLAREVLRLAELEPEVKEVVKEVEKQVEVEVEKVVTKVKNYFYKPALGFFGRLQYLFTGELPDNGVGDPNWKRTGGE